MRRSALASGLGRSMGGGRRRRARRHSSTALNERSKRGKLRRARGASDQAHTTARSRCSAPASWATASRTPPSRPATRRASTTWPRRRCCKAVDVIQGIVATGVELGKVTSDDGAAMLARLSTTTSVAEAVAGVGVVIEAAPEQLDAEAGAARRRCRRSRPADAVVASNTSALGITEMAAVLDRPGRMGGMHFFNPVHKMKLVEIVQAPRDLRRRPCRR